MFNIERSLSQGAPEPAVPGPSSAGEQERAVLPEDTVAASQAGLPPSIQAHLQVGLPLPVVPGSAPGSVAPGQPWRSPLIPASPLSDLALVHAHTGGEHAGNLQLEADRVPSSELRAPAPGATLLVERRKRTNLVMHLFAPEPILRGPIEPTSLRQTPIAANLAARETDADAEAERFISDTRERVVDILDMERTPAREAIAKLSTEISSYLHAARPLQFIPVYNAVAHYSAAIPVAERVPLEDALIDSFDAIPRYGSFAASQNRSSPQYDAYVHHMERIAQLNRDDRSERVARLANKLAYMTERKEFIAAIDHMLSLFKHGPQPAMLSGLATCVPKIWHYNADKTLGSYLGALNAVSDQKAKADILKSIRKVVEERIPDSQRDLALLGIAQTLHYHQIGVDPTAARIEAEQQAEQDAGALQVWPSAASRAPEASPSKRPRRD